MRARLLVARVAFLTNTKGFGNMTGKIAVGHLLGCVTSAGFKTRWMEEVCFADLCYKPDGTDSWSRVIWVEREILHKPLTPRILSYLQHSVVLQSSFQPHVSRCGNTSWWISCSLLLTPALGFLGRVFFKEFCKPQFWDRIETATIIWNAS